MNNLKYKVIVLMISRRLFPLYSKNIRIISNKLTIVPLSIILKEMLQYLKSPAVIVKKKDNHLIIKEEFMIHLIKLKHF